ncbi:class I SAM-dependent DNA methyltransferase [Velocimicrobium porci]|uniref:Class I SAM-dependent methyltransferase n=1 Tax=Velocimicrobium porci TaxID=2606634 RepID=A0A6L5XUT1_9FIRM|nr:class I SAM-dependent methyltransferase [Velocimicrobium porci]MSS62575.1 class I SAM-dependent methyltransferase [Velocimicrobium porci]
MEAYTGFAQVYDEFMDNIPYDEWSNYVISLLNEYHIKDGIVADLGCGTGNVTEHLAHAGYDMIGIDNSEEMLMIAREKAMDHEQSILYLLQDMREFELYGTVSAFVSICDSINYILDSKDLLKVFKLVNNYLDREGLFIFDLNTEYKYQTVLADNTFAENREDSGFIWDNYYDSDTQINQYDLAVFVKADIEESEEEDGEIFYRFQETHYQKAYSLEEIKELLKKAGMEFVTAYDAFTKEPPKENSERIYVIAKEGRQKGKYYI